MGSPVNIPNLSLALNFNPTGNSFTCCVRAGSSPRKDPRTFGRKDSSEALTLGAKTKLMVTQKKGEDVLVKRKYGVPFIQKKARKQRNQEAIEKYWKGLVEKNGEAFASVFAAFTKYDINVLYINRKSLRVGLIHDIDNAITLKGESRAALNWVLKEVVFVAKILKKMKRAREQENAENAEKGKSKKTQKDDLKKVKIKEKDTARVDHFMSLVGDDLTDKEVKKISAKIFKIEPLLGGEKLDEMPPIAERIENASLVRYEEASALLTIAERLKDITREKFPHLSPEESLVKYFEKLRIGKKKSAEDSEGVKALEKRHSVGFVV